LKSSFSLPLQGEAGGKGVWGKFRPPSPLMKSVRIFSNTHRSQHFLSRTEMPQKLPKRAVFCY